MQGAAASSWQRPRLNRRATSAAAEPATPVSQAAAAWRASKASPFAAALLRENRPSLQRQGGAAAAASAAHLAVPDSLPGTPPGDHIAAVHRPQPQALATAPPSGDLPAAEAGAEHRGGQRRVMSAAPCAAAAAPAYRLGSAGAPLAAERAAKVAVREEVAMLNSLS